MARPAEHLTNINWDGTVPQPPASGDAARRYRGRFLLSINDTPGVRETFGSFHLREVSVTYTVSQLGSAKAAELIVSNFALPAVD